MRRALWPECRPERHELEIQQLTAAEGLAVVLVAARENGSLCGFAELSIRHGHVDGASSEPVAYLEGWYVDPDVRGAGIGRRLLEAAVEGAKEAQARELMLFTSPKLTAACNLYRSYGFAEVPLRKGEQTPYKRETIKMQLELKSSSMQKDQRRRK